MFGVGNFINVLCQIAVNFFDGSGQLFITQQPCTPVDEPARLNVVAVAVQINQAVIVVVKEHQLAVQLRAVNFGYIDVQNPHQRGAHLVRGGGFVKTGVAFKNV